MRTPLAPLLALAAAALSAPAAISAQEPDAPAPTQTQTTTVPAQTTPAPPPATATQPTAPPAAQPAPAAEPKPAEAQEIVDPDSAPAPEPVARIAAAGSVTIKDFSFGPATVTVNVGDTVTWSNSGPTGHSATASDGSFDTGILKKGQSGSHTFGQAGTFAYICTPHPFMKGTVKVIAASSGGGADDASGGGTAPAADDTDSSADTAAAEEGDGPSLPATGDRAGLAFGVGLFLAAAGLALRRRLSARP